MEWKKNKRLWIKLGVILVVLLCLVGLIVRFVPFPWYVHEELPMVYYQTGEDTTYETGIIEVKGWMLCYCYKPDKFYGRIESLMGDATFGHREYQAEVSITFNQNPKPPVKLDSDYRYVHFDRVRCEGDVTTFVKYWYDNNRVPIIKGRFKSVILQLTEVENNRLILNSYCVCPGTSAWIGQRTLNAFTLENPNYPLLPLR